MYFHSFEKLTIDKEEKIFKRKKKILEKNHLEITYLFTDYPCIPTM